MILKRKIQNCTEQCYSSHEVTMLRLLSHGVLSYMWLRTEVRVQKNGIDKELVWMAISGKESILYRQWKCSYLLVLGCKIILTDGVNFILVQLQNVVEVKPLFCKNLWTVGLNQYTLHVQKTRWNLFIDESGPTYLAAILVAKKSAFVSLGLF